MKDEATLCRQLLCSAGMTCFSGLLLLYSHETQDVMSAGAALNLPSVSFP